MSSAAAGASDPTGVVPVVHVVTGGLSAPLDVADAGDGSGRIFVAEQAGRIRIVRDGTLVERPFLDITGRIASGGERGLLGIAFHPGYPTDPRLFVDYTDKSRQHGRRRRSGCPPATRMPPIRAARSSSSM